MAEFTPIEDVPPTPGRGFDPKEVYNPMDEDFEPMIDSKPLRIVPAKGKQSYPEFQARCVVKHLAMKIVNSNFYTELEAQVARQQTEAAQRAVAMQPVPANRYKRMEAWLLNPVDASPEEKPEKKPEIKEPELKPELPPETKEPKETKETKDISELSWVELKKLASEKGILKPSMKKVDIIKALK